MPYSIIIHADTPNWSYICLLRDDNVLESLAVREKLEPQITNNEELYKQLYDIEKYVVLIFDPRNYLAKNHMQIYNRVKTLVLAYKLSCLQ